MGVRECGSVGVRVHMLVPQCGEGLVTVIVSRTNIGYLQ